MQIWVDTSCDSSGLKDRLRDCMARLPEGIRATVAVEPMSATPAQARDLRGVVFVAQATARSYRPQDAQPLIVVPVLEAREILQKTLVRDWTSEAFRLTDSGLALEMTVRRSLVALQQRLSVIAEREELVLKQKHIGTMNELGAKLTGEPHLETLLALIVTKAREIMRADAGSLYLVEENDEGVKVLSFLVAQNDSVQVPFKAFQMPLSATSIAGFVAIHGEQVRLDDVYNIADDAPYSFNRSFDASVGYRSKSMLVFPMVAHTGEVTGVLQLINKKHSNSHIFSSVEDFEANALPFTDEDLEIGEALGSQAAIAVENAKLYGDIQKLLESFMRASVKAIEARDPTTSGHSERVARYTVELARTVDRIDSGILARESFSRRELDQLYFAGILHDFGKIGVREDVLIKAKKLYPYQMQSISDRFQYLRRVVELRSANEKLALVSKDPRALQSQAMHDIDQRQKEQIDRLDAAYRVVLESNEPTVLHQEEAEVLASLLEVSILDVDGQAIPLITPDEYRNLSIGKGSLNEDERLEIESHVTHTYNFLKMIPWTRELQDVPEIAYGHHEKLDGSGYPRQLHEDEIPIQMRLMTVSDIFDALTARDRPYKRAVPLDRALNILEMEVREGKLDSDIVQTFIDAKVYDIVLGQQDL